VSCCARHNAGGDKNDEQIVLVGEAGGKVEEEGLVGGGLVAFRQGLLGEAGGKLRHALVSRLTLLRTVTATSFFLPAAVVARRTYITRLRGLRRLNGPSQCGVPSNHGTSSTVYQPAFLHPVLFRLVILGSNCCGATRRRIIRTWVLLFPKEAEAALGCRFC
jgi:hypothetical protein